MAEDLVIASNRGPMSFSYSPAGELKGRQGAGGLVSSLGPLVEGAGATWVAAAMSDADRAAAKAGLTQGGSFHFRFVDLDPAIYHQAYDEISNATLWFLNHRLFDLARRPQFDATWRDAWHGYRTMNERFAETIADYASDGATVLVQDYHLNLVGSWLRRERPDLRTVHFTHTPFMDPVDARVLPTPVAEEMLDSMTAFTACGFHTRAWAAAFEACCCAVLGSSPRAFVAPLAPDGENMALVATTPECLEAGRRLDEMVRGRRIILRVDRIEPSKNLLRGFSAYEDLLARYPEWVGKVVLVALAYPSRESMPDYIAYRVEVEALVAGINQRWSTPDWTPVLLDTRDDFPRSVAALQRYDVLLVNPIRDGLNLVAKEGPLVNRRDGVLVLSREAGVWDELAGVAMEINPFDVGGTTEVLASALALSDRQRHDHAAAVRARAEARTPRDWLEDQLAAARS